MSDDHHSHGPFDPDDPFSMVGIAMIGMALQEAAEQEQRERPYSRPQPGASSYPAWLIAAVVAAGILIFLCLVMSSG